MFKVILTATDGSGQAKKAVRIAAQLAAAHGSRLVVVTVPGHGEVPESLRHMAEVEHLVPPEHVGGTQVENISGNFSVAHGAMTAAQRERVHQVIAERLVNESVSVARGLGVSGAEGVVESGGPPSARIAARAEQEAADLVVMGTRGLSDLKGLLLGSVSHRVCQRAACPCMLVK